MANFKPQVRYMTSSSLHDYNVGRYGVTTEYTTKKFNTYSELKKALKEYILHNHIGGKDDLVTVTRSRRGYSFEWFEKWQLVNGIPTIVKKGWQ